MSNFKNQTFDDRDTGNLRYQGSWFLTGSWNASNVGETGTLSSTSDIEANVTFYEIINTYGCPIDVERHFQSPYINAAQVPAKAFYYYGIRRCCGGSYGICIDCDPNNRVFIPIDAVNASDDGKNPPVVLYSMTFKQPGVHEIIIRNENDTRFGKSQITLDRIDLEVVDNSVSSTSSVPSASSVSSASSTTTTDSSTTSVVPAASSSAASAPIPPIGAIAGGVAGGAILIIALAVYFLFARRRRRRIAAAPAPRDSLLASSRSEHFPDPFPVSPTAAASRLEMQQTPVPFSNSTIKRSPGDLGYGYSSGKRHRGRPPPAPASSFSSASRSTEPQNLPSVPTPIRELDAGPVNFTDDDAQSTLPPEYTQVFPQVRYLPPIPNSQQVAEESAPFTSGHEIEGPIRHGNLSPRRGKF